MIIKKRIKYNNNYFIRAKKGDTNGTNLSCLFVDSNRKANRALKPKSGKLSKQGLGPATCGCLGTFTYGPDWTLDLNVVRSMF